MLGDRAKHCIFELYRLMESDELYDEDAINEIMADATKDINELIEKANECDTLYKKINERKNNRNPFHIFYNNEKPFAYAVTEEYIEKYVSAKEERDTLKDEVENAWKEEKKWRNKVQEYSLKIYKTLPIYKLISNTGPRHKPSFKVAVKLKDSKFFTAQGNSKKDAEQNAATLCLGSIKKK